MDQPNSNADSKSKTQKSLQVQDTNMPSTSSNTANVTRFDVKRSKYLFLKVASDLVSENLIFGEPGRKKFRQIYKDRFPKLDEG